MDSPSRLVAIGIAALAIGATQPAEATTYLLDYAFAQEVFGSEPPHAASLKIETANRPNRIGGYDVLSIRGNVDGDRITSLLANPDPPNTFDSPDGAFFYNNVFFPNEPVFDGAGIMFNSATFEYNIFSNPDAGYTLAKMVPFAPDTLGVSEGTLDVAAVPAPLGLGLILAGIGALGVISRRRRVAG